MRKLIHTIIPPPVRSEIKRLIFRRPRICPQLRAWAEASPDAQIIKVYWETHERTRPLPPAGEGEMPEVFLKNTRYPVYDRTLLKIRQIRISGRSGMLTLPDGQVSHQTAWAREQITETAEYRKRWAGPVVTKSGNYSTLILFWGLGYYHWFNDVLSLLYENLALMPPDTKFIVPSDIQKYHLQALEVLGVTADRLEYFDGSQDWVLENFWWQPPAVHPDNQTPGAMRWMGEAISSALPRSGDEKPLRIYVSRKLPWARVIQNERQILPVLEKHGFTLVRNEEHSFEAQVRLFRNAEAVTAPHGAGLTNLIFCRPETPVLEMFSRDNVRRCYWTLSTELGLPYRFLLGVPVPGRLGEADISVEPSKLDAILAAMF
ncbi:MAG: glycosyltransferase family 61 protein [Verrucomicrobiota bacterium]